MAVKKRIPRRCYGITEAGYLYDSHWLWGGGGDAAPAPRGDGPRGGALDEAVTVRRGARREIDSHHAKALCLGRIERRIGRDVVFENPELDVDSAHGSASKIPDVRIERILRSDM